MPAKTAATLSTFEIKSANLPLVALLLKSVDLQGLERDLAQRFGDTPDFFDQDPLVLDLGPLNASQPPSDGERIDFAALIHLLKSYKVMPLAVKGGTNTQMADALAAGLLPTPDVQLATRQNTPQAEGATESIANNALNTTLLDALIIDKPLRSGQQVYARGRDLVVLAMVNVGAEVIADGHIHVYAPLRGKAIAGARGNGDARIFALSLEAQLLSIAGVYRTSEHPLPASVQGRAAQVRLATSAAGDKLEIEALGG